MIQRINMLAQVGRFESAAARVQARRYQASDLKMSRMPPALQFLGPDMPVHGAITDHSISGPARPIPVDPGISPITPLPGSLPIRNMQSNSIGRIGHYLRIPDRRNDLLLIPRGDDTTGSQLRGRR